MALGNRQSLDTRAIEALLPWHVAGVLDQRDARMVDAALACDRQLAARYAAVQDEWAATVRVNEDLGMPSPRAWQRLLAAIEAEPQGARRPGSPLLPLTHQDCAVIPDSEQAGTRCGS